MSAADAKVPRPRAAAMPFIMLTVLIDMVSIGLIIPVLAPLVGTFTGDQGDHAFWYGVITFAFGFASFWGSPILGALSDQHGRRPVLLLGFFGLALSFIGFQTLVSTVYPAIGYIGIVLIMIFLIIKSQPLLAPRVVGSPPY